MINIAICCGGRNLHPSSIYHEWLIAQFAIHNITTVYHGNCRGADKFAANVASLRGLTVKSFDADWSRYGRHAGPIRNEEMLMRARVAIDVTKVFTLALPGGHGTRNMIKQSREYGAEVIEYEVEVASSTT